VRFWGPEDFPSCRESSELLERRSSAGIRSGSTEFSELQFGWVQELCQNSMNSNREPTLESLWCIGVLACRDYPTTLPQSGWFANHSKSFIHCSYVICALTYHIVELVFVWSYIWSRVWGSIKYSGTWCGDYYLIPWRLSALIRRKILDNAID
jgi:hypothetical protein